MRLVFDQMLKNLASWCRILGLDSEFYSGEGDTKLLELAEKGGLVLVTRDIQLAERARKRDVRCISVGNGTLEEQIAQVVRESGAEIGFPGKTRCPLCNSELKQANPEEMEGLVPQDIIGSGSRLWRCAGCGKAYWEGSHWRNIERFVDKVKRLL